MNDVIRTFASRPFVVVARDTGDIIGSSGNLAYARALGASVVGENGYSIVDLSDVDAFGESADNAGDIFSSCVASFASGMTVAEIADYYRHRMDPRAIYDSHARTTVTVRDARHVVAEHIRDAIGSLSRTKARRQIAEWILAGAVG